MIQFQRGEKIPTNRERQMDPPFLHKYRSIMGPFPNKPIVIVSVRQVEKFQIQTAFFQMINQMLHLKNSETTQNKQTIIRPFGFDASELKSNKRVINNFHLHAFTTDAFG